MVSDASPKWHPQADSTTHPTATSGVQKPIGLFCPRTPHLGATGPCKSPECSMLRINRAEMGVLAPCIAQSSLPPAGFPQQRWVPLPKASARRQLESRAEVHGSDHELCRFLLQPLASPNPGNMGILRYPASLPGRRAGAYHTSRIVGEPWPLVGPP